jgi:hypothetical protein
MPISELRFHSSLIRFSGQTRTGARPGSTTRRTHGVHPAAHPPRLSTAADHPASGPHGEGLPLIGARSRRGVGPVPTRLIPNASAAPAAAINAQPNFRASADVMIGVSGAVNDDPKLSGPFRVLPPENGYHDIGASPGVGGVLDSPLRAVECPQGCPAVVPTRHPATHVLKR